MKERDIVKIIRESLKRDFGTWLHKQTGGPFAEIGASDLYGTLPGGRAIYIEVKKPQTKGLQTDRAVTQRAWLDRERALGAVAIVASSYEEVLTAVNAAGIYPHGQKETL